MLALVVLPRRRPGAARWPIAGLFLLAGFGAEIHHACHAGDPNIQLWLPALAAAVTTLFVASGRAAMTLGVLLIALSIFLPAQYLGLVHRSDFTGNPAWALQTTTRHAAAELERLEEPLQESDAEGTTPPAAGWLDDVAFAWRRPADFPSATSAIVRERWHTSFTRLWRVERTPLRVWYPGGWPWNAAAHLAWRKG